MNTLFFKRLRVAIRRVAKDYCKAEGLHLDEGSISYFQLSRPFTFVAHFSVMTRGGELKTCTANVNPCEDSVLVCHNGTTPVRVFYGDIHEEMNRELCSRPPTQQALVEAATLANWHKDHRSA